MKTEEGKVKDKVRDLLREYGAYWFMPVQMGYGQASLDFLCCLNGRFVAIETKAPGKIYTRLTMRQYRAMQAITNAGGIAIVTSDPDELRAELDKLVARS
jgi:hypothetical protein